MPDITWTHPFPPREAQTDIIDWVNENQDADILAVEAPTGVGKSPICTAIASSGGGIILTPQITLQEQYMRDFPWLSLVKGAANYQCHKTGKDCKVSAAMCQKACKRSGCPYKEAKRQFIEKSRGTTNYAYLFALLPYLEPSALANKRWLIFDEGHHLESQLIESSAIHITPDFCKSVGADFTTPDDQDSAYEEITLIWKHARAVRAGIIAKIDSDEQVPDSESALVGKIEEFETKYMMYRDQRGEHAYVFYISDDKAKGKSPWGVKPLFAHGAWQSLIGGLDKKVFITSATILDPLYFAECLGVSDIRFHAVDSPFEAGNRKVYIRPVASLNFNNMQQEFPKVVRKIDEILGKFGDYKGIIHSHSFKMTDQIGSMVDHKHKWRLIVHKPDSDREELLKRFHGSEHPMVLVSPSMTEGIDLKEDLGRFAIFPKVPYPSLGDKWVKARNGADERWYPTQVAKTIIQGAGRVCRSQDDWGYTFILDGAFDPFFARNMNCFPDWFTHAIR